MIAFMKDPNRIAFAGDWHGNTRFALAMLEKCHALNVNVIIHVGDFGMWAWAQDYLDALNDYCAQYNMIIMFVDGNHEDFPLLYDIPVDEDGVRRVRTHIWHLPRGFRWEWFDTTYMALGGAYSVNREGLRENVDWFEDEIITIPDAYKAVEGGHVDVLITHDCPEGVLVPNMNEEEGIELFGKVPMEKARQHRTVLRQIVDEVTPRFIWHGHLHRDYEFMLELDGNIKCRVRGLDKDKSTFEKNVEIVDTYTLAPWWCE